ncbi:MAG: acyl-CoA thioesterase [Oscillospiraceae bacterium]|nr:acyl-CoA thioesterase [Oscillospiraceae bacterium]
MLTTLTRMESRYPDCDRMGIVHHAVYPVWIEAARMDWLNRAGIPFALSQSLGLNPAMVELNIRYLAPATYPQTILIETCPGLVAPKKLELLYTLRDEAGRTLSEGRTFHIWTGRDNRSCNMQEVCPELYARLLQAAGEE